MIERTLGAGVSIERGGRWRAALWRQCEGLALSWTLVAAGATQAQATVPAECSATADCAERCEAEVAVLNAPGAPLAPVGGAQCTTLTLAGTSGGCGGGPGTAPQGPFAACECTLQSSEPAFLYLTSAEAYAPGGCVVRGRAGDCLFGTSEFLGCSSSDSASCRAACDFVGQRREEDRLRTFGATLLGATCTRGFCSCVLQVGGSCRVGAGIERYDCALGAEEIVRRQAAAQPAPEGCAAGGRRGAEPLHVWWGAAAMVALWGLRRRWA
jgi:hypothetical protein